MGYYLSTGRVPRCMISANLAVNNAVEHPVELDCDGHHILGALHVDVVNMRGVSVVVSCGAANLILLVAHRLRIKSGVVWLSAGTLEVVYFGGGGPRSRSWLTLRRLVGVRLSESGSLRVAGLLWVVKLRFRRATRVRIWLIARLV